LEDKMCKTHEPVIRCACGEIIHEGEMCEACQKERGVRTIEDSVDALFIDDHAIDDDEFNKSREHADEMRSSGTGR
jgi:hypothetical protein